MQTMTSGSAPRTADVLAAMAATRDRTLSLVEPDLRTRTWTACTRPDHEPAGLGSRRTSPPTRTCGSIHRAAAASRCCARTWPRSTTRSRRRATCAATSSSCAARRCGTWRRSARARSALERARPSELHELVIRHELQHTETMLQAMPRRLARRRAARFAGPAPTAAGLELVEVPGGRVRDRAPAPTGFAYDNERPRHAVDVRRFAIGRTPVTNATWLSLRRGRRLRAPRVVDGRGLGVEAVLRHHAPRGGWAGGPPSDARRARRTSPGSRPTPSPAPRGAPADRGGVGEGGDLGPGGLDGVGHVWEWTVEPRSPATRVSSRTRTGSIPRCSSATATGCCAAARAPRPRASPRRRSATGTCPNAASSSPESGSRDE